MSRPRRGGALTPSTRRRRRLQTRDNVKGFVSGVVPRGLARNPRDSPVTSSDTRTQDPPALPDYPRATRTRTHTRTHVHTHTQVPTHVHIHTCTHTGTRTCSHVRTHTCTHPHIHVRAHTRTRTPTHTRVHTHTYTQVCTHTSDHDNRCTHPCLGRFCGTDLLESPHRLYSHPVSPRVSFDRGTISRLLPDALDPVTTEGDSVYPDKG